jgi:hypothetical protein
LSRRRDNSDLNGCPGITRFGALAKSGEGFSTILPAPLIPFVEVEMTVIKKLEREARKKFKQQRKQARKLERRQAQTRPTIENEFVNAIAEWPRSHDETKNIT